jgi:hypothetical protein
MDRLKDSLIHQSYERWMATTKLIEAPTRMVQTIEGDDDSLVLLLLLCSDSSPFSLFLYQPMIVE